LFKVLKFEVSVDFGGVEIAMAQELLDVLADRLQTTREMVDYYERRAVNPALEVVRGCAKALNVPMIELLGSEDNTNGRKRRGTGPTGKMRRLFEAASQLPRSQQEKITALLEPFIAHHAGR
jgi:transcriptional regulator with XRE-family HTH domain